MSIKIKILKIKIGPHSFDGNKVKIRPKKYSNDKCMHVHRTAFIYT